jgi:hypothetical protein
MEQGFGGLVDGRYTNRNVMAINGNCVSTTVCVAHSASSSAAVYFE